jgi:hypothetical protein
MEEGKNLTLRTGLAIFEHYFRKNLKLRNAKSGEFHCNDS